MTHPKKPLRLYRVKMLAGVFPRIIKARSPSEAVRKYHRECCGENHPGVNAHIVRLVERPSR